MLLGTDVQAAYTTASGLGIDVFGLNCSTGLAEMEPSVRWLDENGGHDLLAVPNAGMPRNEGGGARRVRNDPRRDGRRDRRNPRGVPPREDRRRVLRDDAGPHRGAARRRRRGRRAAARA